MENEPPQDEIKIRFEEARRSIRAEAEEKLRALDLAESIITAPALQNGSDVLSSGAHILSQVSTSSSTGESSEHKRRFRITPEVRRAISEASEKFSQQDISEIIERKYPDIEVHRGSVSNALARMRSRGELVDGHYIELAEEGGGSAPNIYKKVRDTDTSEEASGTKVQDTSTEKQGEPVNYDDVEIVEEDSDGMDFSDIPF